MDYENKSRRKIGFVIMAVCLAAIMLGIGVGAGYAVISHMLPEAEAAETLRENTETTSFTTVRLNPLVVPIEINEPAFVDIIPEVKQSVVSINVTAMTARGFGRGEVPGSGSGFIFAQDDEYVFIATNNHVVENTTSITISLDDNESVAARIVGYDRASDVAVIAASRSELAEKGVPYGVAELGDSDTLRMGDPVIAIGNAMGEGQTVTRGIISALSLNIEIPDARNRLHLNVLQTDAAVNRGNSGGPLINQYGEVIGIVTAKLIGADIEGMGYALPINNVQELLSDIMELGSVRRTFLGIAEADEISEFMRSLFNLPSTGMLVRAVVENSPAYESGLQRGDLIVQIGTHRVYSRAGLQDAIESFRSGDEVPIVVYREGERVEMTATLTSRMN